METLEQQAVFMIAATVVASYLYILLLAWLRNLGRSMPGPGLEMSYLIRKAGGFILLGVIPGLVAWFLYGFGPVSARLNWGQTSPVWIWIAGASLFFIILNVFTSRNRDIQAVYPELRADKWGWGKLSLGVGGWVLYLAGYEYLFRGLLLFTCYEAFGLWPAVVINLALYSALHLPKGMKEAIAAIPFGALLCYLTIESQSIVAAIFIHAIQAVSCEMLCIWRNPGMKFNLK